MMFNRNIIIFLLILLAYATHAQTGMDNSDQNKLYGIWLNNEYGYDMKIILNQDGTGEIDGDYFKYTEKDNQLTIMSGQKTTVYTYKLNGNSLTVSGGDLIGAVVFSRHAAEGSIAESVIIYNQAETQKNIPNPENSPDNLLGIWMGERESIEFFTDAKCGYLGEIYPYEVKDGYVTLYSPEGPIMFQYFIEGNILSLTYNGKTVMYKRGDLSDINNDQQHQNPGKGEIAAELVGKWCFVDVSSYNEGASSTTECIMLNEDGTYEYFTESARSVNTPDLFGGTSSHVSDRGTWSYGDGLLYYNSQARGEGSLILEKKNHPKNANDPMIVLNGRAFVTQTIKPPW